MTPPKLDKKTDESPAVEIGLSEALLDKVGFLLNKAAIKIREAYEAQLAPLGLNPKHYGVLTALEEKGSISQHEIGKSICVDRTTMVQILDDLEKIGLVERKEHPTDRRSHAVYLTAKSKETLAKAHRISSAVDKQFLESLSAKEQKELFQLLRKLVITHYSPVKS
ncbi:MAG TPA: MarR family transcriptional regulator [bacterium]|nr:MarR family transcriptional regulator [bacterium]